MTMRGLAYNLGAVAGQLAPIVPTAPAMTSRGLQITGWGRPDGGVDAGAA